MSNELLEALNILEQEKNISKETLLEAIENSLVTACKNHFGKSDNVKVEIDPETCAFSCYQEKTVVDAVEDPVEEISLADAHKVNGNYQLGDIVRVEVKSKEFGRIATQNAKNVILQKIREEERKVIFDEYNSKEKDVVTGVVQRYIGKNVSINLGKADALLTESEQIKGEVFKPTERIKVYILEVKSTSKGPKILVSRTHPELVKRLFESEVTEVKEGIVEIKAISREAGSRTKIAVWSNDPNVDPVGACVGLSRELSLFPYQHKRNPHFLGKGGRKNESPGLDSRHGIYFFSGIDFSHPVDAVAECLRVPQYSRDVVKKNARLWKIWDPADNPVQNLKILVHKILQKISTS